ncbi:MAG: tripartite tricarboxylate transporter TctB family protein [Pseudolabrys sp.]
MSKGQGAGLALKIRAPRDFWGGLVLVAIAAIAIYAASDLSSMEGMAFGAGTAPRLFATLLGIAGAIVAVMGLLSDGPTIGGYAIRGPLLVAISILGFAVMVRPFGLAITSFLTYLIAICGSREMRMVESLIAAAAMTVFCILLFVYLLELPFNIWPALLG